MIPRHVESAIHSNGSTPEVETALDVWELLLDRIKPDEAMRTMPISPVELALMRRSLLCVIDALDAAQSFEPTHFRLVQGDATDACK